MCKISEDKLIFILHIHINIYKEINKLYTGSPINDEPSPTPSSLINPSSLTSSNKDRSTAVKKGYKQSDQSTTMTNNLTSPPASSQQMDTLNSGKHIRGSISASSINNNHRQGIAS